MYLEVSVRDSGGNVDTGMKTGVYLHLKNISRLNLYTVSMNIYAMTFKNIS
jgi:hypothetical protein